MIFIDKLGKTFKQVDIFGTKIHFNFDRKGDTH